jgi:hypothetical protein
MSQTSYGVTMTPAFVGGHAQLIQCITGRNNSGAELPYGRAVVYDAINAGSTEKAVALPSLTGQKIVGAVIFDHAHEIQTTGIPDDGMVSIVSKGQIYMITEQAVTPADPVFVRFNAAGATGTTPAVGQVRKDADTAKADAVTSARFMGVAAAGALVLVDWNLP